MKNSTKYLSLGILICLLSFSFSARAQFYGVNVVEHCWHTAGGTDSTIYAAYLSAAATTKPTRIHFFSVTGTTINAVTVSGGTLRAGPCSNPGQDSMNISLSQILIDNDTLISTLTAILTDNDTIINNLELSLLDNDTFLLYWQQFFDSLNVIITNTQEPQTCNCTYTLDLQNHEYEVAANEQLPHWNFERVVTRNCGSGAEEVFRQAGTKTATSKASTFYTMTTAADSLRNGGVIDSVRIFFKNPDTSAWIYLSPNRVAANYPALLTAGLDTADLRYSASTVATMNAAIETVMGYGLLRVAITHSPPLPFPTFEFNSEINSSGHIILRFYTYHSPTGFYASVNNTSASRRVDYHATASGSLKQSNGAGIIGINIVETANYVLPCDTTISTTYSGTIVPTGGMNWFTLTVQDPAAPTLSGSLGTGTCTQQCPETSECVEICNTEDNPIPVEIITDSCLVAGVVDFPDATSDVYQVAANTVNSITVAVTTGPVSITIVNGSSTKTRSFPTGATFSARAESCEFLQTAFSIDASSGSAAALVSILK